MSTSNPVEITQTTAASSNWYRTPAISTLGALYVIAGTLVSGDTVVVDVSNDDVLDDSLSADRFQSTGTTNLKSSSETFSTTPFSKAIAGNWKWWRITKTGTNGNAVVQMR